MVYCSKCGTKNEEAADTCVKCGAKLTGQREENWEKRLENGAEEFGKRAEVWGENVGKRMEDECFGLPHGGAIFGLVWTRFWNYNNCCWDILDNRNYIGDLAVFYCDRGYFDSCGSII